MSTTTESATSATTSAVVRAMLGTRIAGSAAFFQALREIATAGFQGRTEAEQNSGENRGHESESQHGAADIYFLEARKTLRAELLQEFDTGIGEKNSGGAASEREDQTFREELAEQTRASRAERGADGNFAPASGIAREEKAGDVGAGDEQHERDCANEHHEGGTHVADENAVQRFEFQAPIQRW